jgi:Flp pilus assembly protein TadG
VTLTRCRRRGRSHPDGGAIAVELVILFPMILLVIALVAAYGRLALVNGTFDSGVRDAARAATQERSADAAGAAAREALVRAVEQASLPCLDSLEVDPILVFEPGEPVTVTARCSYPMDDLAVGMPGSVTVEASFSSPLDPNRGTR